jgi:hypothetical protein
MTRKIKQYKPIRFGERPDPESVEGHRNRAAEAAETRRYNRRMKELAVQDAAKRSGWVRILLRFFTAQSGKY